MEEGLLMESKTILIAYTDDPWARSVFTFLKGLGYKIEMVGVLSEVIRTVRNGNVYVILLDDEVEGMKAYDVVPLLKKINLKIQFIAVSSEESLEGVRRLRGGGIFYQAMKPIDLGEIKSAVECALEKIRRESFIEGLFAFLMPGNVPALGTI
jgi:DNA-binding NtrC family response regulator